MSSLTYVVDTPTSSLTSNGLSELAAITLARLVCDTTVGADDLTSTNAQNNFVQELVAAVGPVIAFNAIGRQLDKIRNTVAESSAGTVYASLAANTYKDYLPSYLMRDSFTGIEVTSSQTTSFSAEQIQTLAAFVNAGLPLATLLQVVDYHILMLFLTKSTGLTGASGINTLCAFQQANITATAYATPATWFAKYQSDDNIASAKYVYAISTLAQNGAVVFGDSVPVDHIVAALLADPVYDDVNDKVYGLLASLATVCSSNNAIRSSYSNLIKPVNYSLSITSTIGLSKNTRSSTSFITLTKLTNYTSLPASPKKNMWFYNTVSSGSIANATLIQGTQYDPTQKQLITSSSLQGQSAQEIYTSLNFTSTNSNDNASNELATFKLYGKTIPQIRAVVDSTGYGIPSYNSISNFRAAGYSNTDITNAFSSNVYDFAVLIGVCVIETHATGNRLKYSPNSLYDFKYVAADAIKSSIVDKLRAIVTADSTDAIIGLNTENTTNGSSKLHSHIKSCYNDFASTQITKITAANAEPAILRWLHSSAAMNASSNGTAALDAFTAYNGVDNMYPFMSLKYTLSASPSSVAPTAFLKLSEFAAYTSASIEFSYAIDTVSTNVSTYNKVKSVAATGETRQYFDKYSSTATNLPSKQLYTLGSFAKHYYTTIGSNSKTFDNGFTFVDAYPYMATSAASKIENINAQKWPKEVAYSHTSMLLADISTDIMKNMNSSFPTQVSDDALMLATYPTVFISFTELLVGPQKNNSIDNISYKALLRAGAGAQYIKVDLAKKLNTTDFYGSIDFSGNIGLVGHQFAALDIPFADSLFIARKANSYAFTVANIVTNTKFSRFERRKVFDNVTQAAQQLDKSTFLGLVWQYSDLEANIKGTNPLNIQLVDLLSLTYSAQEADADGYLNTATSRLAYHDAVVRKNMVKLFYPNLSEVDVAIIASLNNVDEILDVLASRSLV